MDTSFVNLARDFGTAIKSIAVSLKVPAEHVYSILCRQYFMEGVFFFLIMLIMAILFGFILIKGVKMESDFFGEELPLRRFWVVIIGSVMVLTVLIMLSIKGQDQFTRMMNPEFHAIEFIVDKLPGGGSSNSKN